MATGYTTSVSVTVSELAASYRAGAPFPTAARMARRVRFDDVVCAYCKRERGAFPTCDGCGASEWVAR